MTADVHRHIAALVAALAEGGYRATLSGSAAEYRAAVSAIEGYHVYSPLDDGLVDMEGEFLFVGIYDTDKRLVAIEAGRVIEAPAWKGGLNAALDSRVFGRVLPVIGRAPHHNLSGRLAYMGGAWTDPALRGRRIMSLTLKLTVAHLVRCFEVDAVFGFVRSKHAGLSLAEEGYGFTSATAVDLMYLPGEAAADTLVLVWTDRGVLKARHRAEPNYRLEVRADVKSRQESKH